MNIVPDHKTIMSRLKRLDSAYQVSPLVPAPELARELGVTELLLKDEGKRPLGSFKSLGGTFAGLNAIDRMGAAVKTLICASDGNHGLAVASAARHAGLQAHIFLPHDVPEERVLRVRETGAHVVITRGTFDDAVREAALAARAEGAVLIPDTSDDVEDRVTGDVMAGYGVIAGEVREQLAAGKHSLPTHIFIQAGVGGLAAAMARGLQGIMAEPAKIVVCEPESAACVKRALETGQPETVAGDLATCASMLSCGRASAPALEILKACNARALSLTEAELQAAPSLFEKFCGIATTPSGAAGLAGLVHALKNSAVREELELEADSRVLLVVSEGRQA